MTIWVLIVTVCIGGGMQCDEYIRDTFETPGQCLAEAPNHAATANDGEIFAISCELATVHKAY